jgi:hypothetical protein
VKFLFRDTEHCARAPLRLFPIAGLIFLVGCLSGLSTAQTAYDDRPVPILTGNAGYFTTVDRGQSELVPEVNPVLLVPFENRWLFEGRAGFEGEFERENGDGPYKGSISKEIDYLQLDFIANRYMTVTAGRFLTPFGIYNERLYPLWIRTIHLVPMIYPIGSGSSDGAMVRGGFSLNPKVNLNYAAFFSTLSTVNKFEADRAAGGRIGLFFPHRRVEVGASWQKELQEERTNAFGFHFAWQPMSAPLTLRSEYARSHTGSGYWVEGAYRFSQVPFWQPVMRRTEFAARMQQFFIGEAGSAEAGEYGLPFGDVKQPDFGLNFYLKDGLKAQASYSRWLGARNWNTWTFGIAYRFAIPLGRVGAQ